MLEYYPIIKHIHVTAAFISVALFFLRGMWMLFSPDLLKMRWAKIVPHVIDTVLLVAALVLAGMWSQTGGPSGWLGAKLLGLILYIVLGVFALKRGRTRGIRATAFVAALLTFAYVVGVAFTKQVLPFA